MAPRLIIVLAGSFGGLYLLGSPGLFSNLTHWSKKSPFECFESEQWQSCRLPSEPYLLVTSDIHLSSESGRWPETTENFSSFLELLEGSPPEEIFIVGDVVDNAMETYPGSIENWREEWGIFDNIKKSFPSIRFRQSYGTGHDWLDDEMLSELNFEFGSKHGVFSWRGLDFMWLSFGPGAFLPGNEDFGSDLDEIDYQWIESVLKDSSGLSLMFHVPLLTPLSEKRAGFSGGRVIALDPRDELYPVLKKNAEKIRQIFSGHIHETFQHDFEGIPYYSCPFMDRQSFCTIERTEDSAKIRFYRSAGN